MGGVSEKMSDGESQISATKFQPISTDLGGKEGQINAYDDSKRNELNHRVKHVKRSKNNSSVTDHRGKYINIFRQIPEDGNKFEPHKCTRECLIEARNDLNKYNKQNPLLIPMFCGFQRSISKITNKNIRVILYRAPCGRRLRTIDEVHRYLLTTGSELALDLFTFDPRVRCFQQFVPENINVKISDLSYGVEKKNLQCVNGIDDEYPNYINYTTKYLYSKDVNIDLDPNFLLGCDCDDDCNNDKCACRKLTIESFNSVHRSQSTANLNIGYEGRRLMQQLSSGIYECNENCKCSNRCVNRVVQNQVTLRLQVFKTDKCGWGVRCLDDLPQGCFVCLFTGQILTDQKANKDGTQYGDEYLAELDYMEVCEIVKEGYEKYAVVDYFDDENNVENSRKKIKIDVSEMEMKKEICENSSTINDTKKLRSLFGDDYCYIIDSKFVGNIGRYLNHCCTPNVFVQSVFVDSHDLRFPWVAFFTKTYVRGGTELTWDYNYKVGSVPDKVMYCYCGSNQCRGRLI